MDMYNTLLAKHLSGKNQNVLKTLSVNGTTSANGNLKITENINIIPLFCDVTNGSAYVTFYKSRDEGSIGLWGHFEANTTPKANTLVEGILYYIEIS